MRKDHFWSPFGLCCFEFDSSLESRQKVSFMFCAALSVIPSLSPFCFCHFHFSVPPYFWSCPSCQNISYTQRQQQLMRICLSPSKMEIELNELSAVGRLSSALISFSGENSGSFRIIYRPLSAVE